MHLLRSAVSSFHNEIGQSTHFAASKSTSGHHKTSQEQLTHPLKGTQAPPPIRAFTWRQAFTSFFPRDSWRQEVNSLSRWNMVEPILEATTANNFKQTREVNTRCLRQHATRFLNMAATFGRTWRSCLDEVWPVGRVLAPDIAKAIANRFAIDIPHHYS